MDNQLELDSIEKQILSIKGNSEYLRLLTAHRGLKDDQRFKAYTLRLTTLDMKKDKLSAAKNQIIASRLSKPVKKVTVTRTINMQPKNAPSIPAPANHLRKIVHESLAGPATPKGKLKAKTSRPTVESRFSTASRTIARPESEQEQEPEQELMIKPTRTSIKPDKVPISQLPEIKARVKARTRTLTSGSDTIKSNRLDNKKTSRIESLDIEDIEDLLDEDF